MFFLFLGSFGTSRRLCQSSSACEPILDDFALSSSFFTPFSSHVFGDVSRAEGPLKKSGWFSTQRSNQLSDDIWIQVNGPSSYFTHRFSDFLDISWWGFRFEPTKLLEPLLETNSAVQLTIKVMRLPGVVRDCKGCPGCQPYIAHTNHTTLGCFLSHGKSHHPKWSHFLERILINLHFATVNSGIYQQRFNFQ